MIMFRMIDLLSKIILLLKKVITEFQQFEEHITVSVTDTK